MSEPVWLPAETHIPRHVDSLMYMGHVDYDRHTIHQYKHCDTRQYINLEDDGTPWELDFHSGGALLAWPISLADAEQRLTD